MLEVAVREKDPAQKLVVGERMHWNQLGGTAVALEALGHHRHSPEGYYCMHWDQHKADLGRESEADGGVEVVPRHMQRVPLDRHYNPVVRTQPCSIHT